MPSQSDGKMTLLSFARLPQLEDVWGRGAPPNILQRLGFSGSVRQSCLGERCEGEIAASVNSFVANLYNGIESMNKLIGESGAFAGQEILLKDQMVLGRSPECDLLVNDANASRQHCRFALEGEMLIVQDLNSSNGTFVNEERVQGQRELRQGDRLRIGETRFLVHRATAPQNVVSIVASRTNISQNASATQLGNRLNAVLKMSEALGTLRSTEDLFQNRTYAVGRFLGALRAPKNRPNTGFFVGSA